MVSFLWKRDCSGLSYIVTLFLHQEQSRRAEQNLVTQIEKLQQSLQSKMLTEADLERKLETQAATLKERGLVLDVREVSANCALFVLPFSDSFTWSNRQTSNWLRWKRRGTTTNDSPRPTMTNSTSAPLLLPRSSISIPKVTDSSRQPTTPPLPTVNVFHRPECRILHRCRVC